MGSIRIQALIGLRKIGETLEEIVKLDALSAQERCQVKGALICVTHALNGKNVEDPKLRSLKSGYPEMLILAFLVVIGGILIGLKIASIYF